MKRIIVTLMAMCCMVSLMTTTTYAKGPLRRALSRAACTVQTLRCEQPVRTRAKFATRRVVNRVSTSLPVVVTRNVVGRTAARAKYARARAVCASCQGR